MSMIDSLLRAIGWEENQQDLVEFEEMVEEEVKPTSKRGNSKKIINMHNADMFNVNTLNVMQLESLEEAREVCTCLKSNQPVIINLENISRDLAQRIIDFVSGAIYSLDGNIKKISAGIFIATPNNFNVEENMQTEGNYEHIENKSVLPWMS